MASLNNVILIGNLTRDPEIRFIQDGTPVANFGIAVNRNKKKDGSDGGVDFFNIVAWRRQAELCGDYISKGSSVCIYGKLQSRSWEQDGNKRTTVEVVADQVIFLDSKGSSNGGGSQAAAQDKSEDFSAAGLDDDIPF